MTDDVDRLATRPLRSRFSRQVVRIAPGQSLAFVAAEWADAIVTVVRGEIDLRGTLGPHRRFTVGAILVLAGLGLSALNNPGDVETVLVAISRAPVRPGA